MNFGDPIAYLMKVYDLESRETPVGFDKAFYEEVEGHLRRSSGLTHQDI